MSKLKGLFIVILIVVVAFSGGLFAYLSGIGAVDPGNKEDVTVVIPEGSGASAIVGVLDEAGLVKNSTFAKVNARIGGYNSLQANTYVFNKSMTLPEIMDAINTGDFEYISKSSFRVAEGARLTQCADALAKVIPHTSEEILAVWDDEAFVKGMIDKYWFLTDDVLDEDIIHPLEGYLFPDTYFIMETNPSIESVTEMALDRMDAVLSEKKAEIEKSKYSIHEFLTLASIVTKEGCATEEDAAHIAGVFQNRLDENMSLGSDVTVCYIFDEDRVDLKVSQLDSDSPYNARKVSGLIPGPISTVPEIAIDGVLNYQKTDDLFFYAGPDGTIYYAKTNEEHDKNVQEHPWTEEDLANQ
ncbi:MAG: endolytic transglycosylase MltG [Clostridiales bacterium]|nr:endolytic transglycosylase MltG [Clostridiales bacterium]